MLDRIGRKRKRGYKVGSKLYLDEYVRRCRNTQLAMKVVVSRVRLQARGAEDVVACFVAAD